MYPPARALAVTAWGHAIGNPVLPGAGRSEKNAPIDSQQIFPLSVLPIFSPMDSGRCGCCGLCGFRGPVDTRRYPACLLPENQMAREILDSHIHSLLAGHLIDVPSSDQHTVKPWFDGKVDYSPTVKDLSGQGFILVGGRLDYVGGRTVGTVVYRRRQHVINLFTWPSSPAHGPASFSTSKQGYNIEAWNADGVEHWAVSDVNRDDLGEFVQLMRQ